MKILRIISVVVAVVVLSVGAIFALTSSKKNEGPQLTCTESSAIIATVGVTDEELLSYVKAYDEQDGDISSHIKVIRKNFFADVAEKTTVVTFAVCDSDNNTATLSRRLIFSDYHSPRISLNNDLIVASGYNYRLSQYVSATDVIDGDLTQYVKVISTDFSNVEGRYPVNIKVSNSMGDTTDITIDAIIVPEEMFDVRVKLNEYLVYTSVGKEIDYAANIKDISNKTDTKYKTSDIKVDSSGVDIATPGVYDAYYRIFNGENEITMTRLVVIVTED